VGLSRWRDHLCFPSACHCGNTALTFLLLLLYSVFPPAEQVATCRVLVHCAMLLPHLHSMHLGSCLGNTFCIYLLPMCTILLEHLCAILLLCLLELHWCLFPFFCQYVLTEPSFIFQEVSSLCGSTRRTSHIPFCAMITLPSL
jgi:hypothetical protein